MTSPPAPRKRAAVEQSAPELAPAREPGSSAVPAADAGEPGTRRPARCSPSKDAAGLDVLPADKDGSTGPGPVSRRSRVRREPAAGTRPGDAPAPAAGDAGGREPGRGVKGALRPGQDAIAAAMSEAELEEHVRVLCKGLGILRFHVRNSRGMDRGWPDDTLIGSRGILFRELKTQRGRVTPDQRRVGEALTALGQDYAVWRPGHLLDGTVARELTALAGIPAGGRGNHPAGRRLPPEGPGGGDAA